MPSRRVDHVTLRLGEGKSVLLGGLARLEVVEGRPFFFTFFLAPGVSIHATPAMGPDADAFVRKHVGHQPRKTDKKVCFVCLFVCLLVDNPGMMLNYPIIPFTS